MGDFIQKQDSTLIYPPHPILKPLQQQILLLNMLPRLLPPLCMHVESPQQNQDDDVRVCITCTNAVNNAKRLPELVTENWLTT